MTDPPQAEPENPYRSPSPFAGDVSYADAAQVSGETIQALRQTRPWVLFLAILGIVVAALISCGSVGLIFFVVGADDMAEQFPFEPIVMVLVYGFLAVMYWVPSILLLRYSSRIGDFLRVPNHDHLNKALFAQRSFWRVIGIIALVGIVLYALLIALSVAGMALFQI